MPLLLTRPGRTVPASMPRSSPPAPMIPPSPTRKDTRLAPLTCHLLGSSPARTDSIRAPSRALSRQRGVARGSGAPSARPVLMPAMYRWYSASGSCPDICPNREKEEEKRGEGEEEEEGGE